MNRAKGSFPIERITLVLALLGLGSSLAGCGGSSGVSDSAPPVVTISAKPSTVDKNGTTTITWSTTGTDTDDAVPCTASGGATGDTWSGSTLASSGTFTTAKLATAGSYTYTLTCTNSAGSGSAGAAVTVLSTALPTVTISANPTTVSSLSQTRLTWSSTGATTCTGSGANETSPSTPEWNGSEATSGTKLVTPNGTTTYTLTCSNAGGSAANSVLVTVATSASPTVAITATPSTFTATGGSSILKWETTNALTCTAENGDGTSDWPSQGAEPIMGTASVGPFTAPGVYTYTLNCTGTLGGTGTGSAVVVVGLPPAPTVTISATPAAITAGQSALLHWTTTNATSCVASGSWSGTEPTFSGSTGVSTGVLTAVGSYSYDLTCTGPGGQAVGTEKLQVTPGSTLLSCGIGSAPTTALVESNGATVEANAAGSVGNGFLCVECVIKDATNVINKAAGTSLTSSFAEIDTPVGVASSQTLTVTGTPSPKTYAQGGPAGFLVSASVPELLTVDLLKGITVQTLNNGVVVDTASNALPSLLGSLGIDLGSGSVATTSPLIIDVLGLLANDSVAFFGVSNTSGPYNAVRLTTTSALGVLSQVYVYAACIATQN